MKYGYIRVSTKEQDETRQIEALRKAGILEKNIYIDKVQELLLQEGKLGKSF